jgi:hypothetical protein
MAGWNVAKCAAFQPFCIHQLPSFRCTAARIFIALIDEAILPS